jgi:hypothetical protein
MATMDGKHMTKDEALDLALEALELNNSEWKSLADSGDAGFWSAEEQEHYKQTEAAITAIKQARALDKMAENARELGLDYEPVEVLGHNGWGFPIKSAAPVQEDWGPGPHECHSLTAAPVQEPVAWRYRGILHDFDPSDWAEGPVTPLYTTPPSAQPTPNVQEPVAYRVWDRMGGISFRRTKPTESEYVEWDALYTTSPNVATPLAAPVVPDVMTTAEGEHPEYVQGWNDCRQLMLQTRKNT